MEKLLFFDHELRLLIEEQKRHLLAEIDSLSEERVLGNPINDLCEYFVNKYIIELQVLVREFRLITKIPKLMFPIDLIM
jgi:DNA integrity scanning protein DisA with diadenylate cyclase activity